MDRHEMYLKIITAMVSNPETTKAWTDGDLDFIAERAWYLTSKAWDQITGRTR